MNDYFIPGRYYRRTYSTGRWYIFRARTNVEGVVTDCGTTGLSPGLGTSVWPSRRSCELLGYVEARASAVDKAWDLGFAAGERAAADKARDLASIAAGNNVESPGSAAK